MRQDVQCTNTRSTYKILSKKLNYFRYNLLFYCTNIFQQHLLFSILWNTIRILLHKSKGFVHTDVYGYFPIVILNHEFLKLLAAFVFQHIILTRQYTQYTLSKIYIMQYIFEKLCRYWYIGYIINFRQHIFILIKRSFI